MNILTIYIEILAALILPLEKIIDIYLSIPDSASGKNYAKAMRTKGQAFNIFQKFICQVERQSGNKLKHLRINFEGESANKAFEK